MRLGLPSSVVVAASHQLEQGERGSGFMPDAMHSVRGEIVRIGQQPGGNGAHGSSATALADRFTGDGLLSRLLRRPLAYIALTKPRVIELLLVATIPTMLLADRGHVDIRLILATLFGGWMGAASANTLNCVADADIDKVMKRTARRPLARDAVPTSHAFVFGMTLGIGSFAW